jgi:hypothetical protein
MAITGVNLELAEVPAKVPDAAVQRELEAIYKAVHLLNSTLFDANMLHVPQYTTAARPAAVAGVLIFDTTLNKLCVGTGAGTWEAVTSV